MVPSRVAGAPNFACAAARRRGTARAGALALLGLSACATVRYRSDGREQTARVREARCVPLGSTQTVSLEAVDDPWFFQLELKTVLTAKAVAPAPLPAEGHEGPAELSLADWGARTFAGRASWRHEDGRVCVRFAGTWVQPHMPESAPRGPGVPDERPVELGPWCSAECR